MGSGTDGLAYGTDSDGDLNVFNVDHDDNGRWLNSNYGKPDNVWNPDNQWVFVLPRQSLRYLSLVVLAGEFCCIKWPCQPPSIRPISSSKADSAAYFLLSNDFVSQSTMSNTFSVSSFLAASRT